MARDRRKPPHLSGSSKRGLHAAQRARARKLSEQTGLPAAKALAVARGEVSLSDAIAELARGDEVKKLMRKHDLSKSIATQVALGQTDLDEYLSKRRLREYMVAHGEDSGLEAWAESGRESCLGLHGQRLIRGKLTQASRYEVTVAMEEMEPEEVHKLQIKFVGPAGTQGSWETGLKMHPDAAAVDPISAPQDRYHLSDRRLMSFMELADRVEIRTLEGEIFVGQIRGFSRWEVTLFIVDLQTEIVIFRHAIADLERS